MNRKEELSVNLEAFPSHGENKIKFNMAFGSIKLGLGIKSVNGG